MPSPEEHFAEFCRCSDPVALAAVFDALAPKLLLVAAHVAPDGAEPEDLVQGTFLDAIEKAGRWDSARPLMPWLIGMLVNRARLERRQLARKVDADRLARSPDPGPEESTAAAEVVATVTGAVAAMPRHYVQVLTLRLVHGLTPTQIAQSLACPVATVKTRLQRGMEMLRQTLPAGLAASVAGLFGSELLGAGPGLRHVREVVLAKVPVATSVAVGAAKAGIVGGSIVMKKLVVAAISGACVLALWFCLPAAESAVPPSLRQDGEAQQARAVEDSPVAPAARPVASPASRRRAVLPVERTAHGGMALEFVWAHDASPARNYRVSASCAGEVDPRFVTHTDAQGRLAIANLKPGTYFLSGHELWHQVTIEAGAEAAERIVVPAALRIHGVVVDSGGRGVAGANVCAQYFPDCQDHSPRIVAVSGEDGTFEGAADCGGYMWAACAGYQPSVCESRPRQGELQLRFVLGETGCRLRGTVRDELRRPVAGAVLTIISRQDAKRCPAPIVLQADAAGQFVSRELAVGDHLLVAQADGFAAAAVAFTCTADEETQLEVVLHKGASIVGTVRDAAGKAAMAQMELRPAWAGGQEVWVEALRPLYLSCLMKATTAADGSYRIDHVPSGSVLLRANPHGGNLPVRETLELQDGVQHTCDFVVRDGAEIVGRLVAVDGRALPDWRVQVDPVGGGVAAQIITAADGRFRAKGLDAAEYNVSASPAGPAGRLSWARAERVRPGAAELLLRVLHRPANGARVVGRVVGRDGQPPAAASLWLTAAGQSRVHVQELELDVAGVFEVGPLPPARYRVSLRMGQEGGVDLGSVALLEDATHDFGTVRSPSRGSLEIRLHTAEGRTVEPTEMRVWDRAGNRDASFARSQDGGWCSRALPAGTYDLWAWGKDFEPLKQRVVVVPDVATPTNLVVKAATPVQLVFTCQQPFAAEVTLTVRSEAGKVMTSRRIALEEGEAEFRCGLPHGRYLFEAAAARGGVTARGSFQVADSALRRVAVSLMR